MSDINLDPLKDIDGFQAAAMFDADTGLTMATIGEGVDLEMAAAVNTEAYRAKRKMAQASAPDERIEDAVVTLGRSYHLIRPLGDHEEIGLYLVLDRSKANIAMARHALKTFEQTLNYG